jgi:transposase InsO family protein
LPVVQEREDHSHAGIQISMDGRGRWMDNVFIERPWRSLKHEDIYLKDYADSREARPGIAAWIRLLQQPASPSDTRLRDPDGGVVRGHRRRGRQPGCGYDGQCKSVAHMPTAATTAADSSRQQLSLHDIRRSERPGFQLRNRF